VFRPGPIGRRNLGLKSETWATHSTSGSCSFMFGAKAFHGRAILASMKFGQAN
jgi:hypothetical protein